MKRGRSTPLPPTNEDFDIFKRCSLRFWSAHGIQPRKLLAPLYQRSDRRDAIVMYTAQRIPAASQLYDACEFELIHVRAKTIHSVRELSV